MATVVVLYAAGGDLDLEYYVKNHMPFVASKWKPLGLLSYEVVSLVDSPYQLQAIMKWTSLDDFESASTGPTSEAVFGDIANFTKIQPVLMKGKIESSG